MMINWKNTAENLALILVGVVVGVIIGHLVTKTTSNELFDIMKPTLEKAIDKESIVNEITNDIAVEVDKIKKSDSLNINITQAPHNDQKPRNVLKPNADCEITKDAFQKLSKNRQDRIKRWLRD
jgi:hypothetical protein